MDYDDAYANAPYIPDADGFIRRWSEDAAAFRDAMVNAGRCDLGVSYGPTERQAYDVFEPVDTPKGTFVFVHGGYWLRFDRSYWSHFARGALDNGWRVVMPSYDLCPDVGIAEITRQIAVAIEQIAAQFDGFLVLAGHSAGGHLVARMACPDVLQGTTYDRIHHFGPISPVSDLRPLIQTTMNESFKLDDQSASAESPALLKANGKNVTVWVGADERPVFLDQARWLAEAWSCGLEVSQNQHHFDVIDPLMDAGSAMMKTLLD